MLLELIVIGAAVALIYQLAQRDSGALWGVLTAAACIASLLVVPFPFIRTVVVAVGMFLVMFIYNAVTYE